MTTSSIKTRIHEDMKSAMRSKDQKTLDVIRLIMSAIKQREVDERISLDDAQVFVVLGKMLKQRQEASALFRAGQRDDLAQQEEFEIKLISVYLPPQLSEAEITKAIDRAIERCSAQSPRDIGPVMTILKTELQDKADFSLVSKLVKAKLSPNP